MDYKKYRFDFTEKVKLMLADFANMNKNATRKEFKEAWSNWLSHTTIKSILDSEQTRMESDGFKGDVLDKMFKSARYYETNKDNILSEFILIKKERGELSQEMVNKLKKTYKNRFYSARKE